MNRFCLCVWISIAAPAFLAGCADTARLNSELASAQKDLRQLEAQSSSAERRIAELQRERNLLKRRAVEAARERDDLETRHARLEARCNDLRRKHQRLRNWAKELVAGYGAGIWTWSPEHDLPLFRKTADSASVRGILDELNLYFRRDGRPTLIHQETRGSTVHLGVSDEMKLTAQMGSTGAAAYIQSVTYSLASLKGVDCVYFDIREGDHAGPGKHCPLGD